MEGIKTNLFSECKIKQYNKYNPLPDERFNTDKWIMFEDELEPYNKEDDE